MALYVKDAEVHALAERLVMLRKTTKTEVVKQALLRELEREQQLPSLIERGLEFGRALRARGNLQAGQPADKAFIDSLYEDE